MSAVILTPGGWAVTQPVDDHHLADEPAGDREFACLVSVTHMAAADPARLRRVSGVTGVIDGHDSADLHMIVPAPSRRAAQRVCVELVAGVVPQAVVTVPDVVDYDAALVDYLDRRSDFAGELPDLLDDALAVAEVLDRT